MYIYVYTCLKYIVLYFLILYIEKRLLFLFEYVGTCAAGSSSQENRRVAARSSPPHRRVRGKENCFWCANQMVRVCRATGARPPRGYSIQPTEEWSQELTSFWVVGCPITLWGRRQMAPLPCPGVAIPRQAISLVALDSMLGSSIHWPRPVFGCKLVPLHGSRSCNLKWARCDPVTPVEPLRGENKRFVWIPIFLLMLCFFCFVHLFVYFCIHLYVFGICLYMFGMFYICFYMFVRGPRGVAKPAMSYNLGYKKTLASNNCRQWNFICVHGISWPWRMRSKRFKKT